MSLPQQLQPRESWFLLACTLKVIMMTASNYPAYVGEACAVRAESAESAQDWSHRTCAGRPQPQGLQPVLMLVALFAGLAVLARWALQSKFIER